MFTILKSLSKIEIKRLLIAFGCLYFLYFISSRGVQCSNDGGHLGLASALRYEHSSNVEKYKDTYVGWPDYAIKDGEMYSDRLPGTAFVLTGFLYYADFWKFLGLQLIYPDQDLNPVFGVFLSIIAGLVLTFVLFLFLLKYFKFTFNVSLFSAIVFAICTLNYQESGRFFSHELSCFLVSISTLIIVAKSRDLENRRWLLLAFSLLSYSVLVELQNILFFVPLSFFSFYKLKKSATFTYKGVFVLALPILFISVIIIAILPLYNYLTFGEWILKSNAYNPNFEEEKSFMTSLSGNFFIGMEKLFFNINSFRPWFGGEFIGINKAPGLLVLCPVFLVSMYGWIKFIKKYPAISILFLSLIVIEVLIAALHKTTLVRHMHTIHLFIFLPFAFAIQEILQSKDKQKKIGIAVVLFLCLYSFLSVQKASHTFNYRTKIPIFFIFNFPLVGIYLLLRKRINLIFK